MPFATIVRTAAITTAITTAIVGASTASAAILYDNGTYNSSSQPLQLNSAYAADTFTLASAGTVTGVEFIAFDNPSTTAATQIEFGINQGGFTSNAGNVGPSIVSGTAAVASNFLFNTASGYYGVYNDSFAIPSTVLAAGTYVLTLAYALPNDAIFWNVNYGPSKAFYYDAFAAGFVPSESFKILGNAPTAAVPEPAMWAMMLIGFGLVGAAARRRAQAAISIAYT